MEKTGDFTCKQCGSRAIKATVESGEQDKPLDAICTNCGAPFTEDDIRLQLIDAADKIIAPYKRTKVFNLGRKK